MSQLRAFLIADEPIAMTLRADLAHDGLPVHFTWDGAHDIATAARRLPDSGAEIIVLQGGEDPLSDLRTVREAAPGIPVVLLGHVGDFKGALEAVRQGAQDVLLADDDDPFGMARRIRFALEREQLRRQQEPPVAHLSAHPPA